MQGAKSVGVQSGAGGSYNYGKDWLRMYPMGMGMDGVRTFVHELGHRFYYKNLKERVREAWDKALRRRQVEIKEHHVDSFFAKYIAHDIDDERVNRKKTEALIKKNENDPTLKRIYIHLVHNFPRWYVEKSSGETTRENYLRKQKEYEANQWIDLLVIMPQQNLMKHLLKYSLIG